MKMLYIIGAPGAGKTTCLQEALANIDRMVEAKPFAHTLYHAGKGFCHGVELGCQREGHGGTDVLPMNVQPTVVGWLQTASANVIVAEGDRLGNDKFFQSVVKAGWDLTVCWLATDAKTRLDRCVKRGSAQDPTWMKGRATKVERLGQKWVDPRWCIDGEQSVEEVVWQLRRHPVIKQLRGE